MRNAGGGVRSADRGARRFCRILVTTAILLSGARAAAAQADPPPGVRAAAMGGAFTAAADDASAVVWNPAALAAGSYFSLLADVNLLHASASGTSNDGTSNGGTSNGGTSNGGTSKDVPYLRRTATLFALGTPPLGLSYRRTVTLTAAGTSPTAAVSTGRNTAGEVRNQAIVAHHVGVTLVHSLADGLSVGATLKVVHAFTTTFDADLGVMKAGAIGRLGLTISNVREPMLSSPADGDAIRLDRRVRAGAAVNLARATLVAVDVDLNKTHGPLGLGREVAVGVEHQPFARSWVRGGLRSVGGHPAISGGASYAVYGKTQVDAQVTWSSKQVARSWGIGIRWVF